MSTTKPDDPTSRSLLDGTRRWPLRCGCVLIALYDYLKGTRTWTLEPVCSSAAAIPRLEQYLAELTQPRYRTNPVTGKLQIDKRGDENEKSPDSYDATALAFARDSDAGLRARL